MVYSEIYFGKHKKFPTIIAAVIICFILIFFIRLLSNNSVPSKAAKKILTRIDITNLLPNQTTIVWQTDKPSKGWVMYGNSEQNISLIALDDRDLQSQKNPYRNHYTTLHDLNQNRTYYFRLVSDDSLISKNDGSAFTFTTPGSGTTSGYQQPAYGKIIMANDTPLTDAVVLLQLNNAYALSALSKDTGEWLIPLNSVYDRQTISSRTVSPSETATIDILSGDSDTVVKSSVSKLSPLPQTIIVGKNMDFTQEPKVLGVESQISPTEAKQIDVIYPQEGALIPGYRPLIKGIALPNAEVNVAIQGQSTVTSKTHADADGVWRVTLPVNLTPGSHTLIATTNNPQGNNVLIQRTFTIAKNGEQVLGIATPESTLTPTEQPQPTALPTYVAYGTPTPKPPVSGSADIPPVIGGASLVIMGLGLLLVF